ncbi:MAG: AMP-binding protein, partial [Alphaproteobacteria bacterium]
VPMGASSDCGLWAQALESAPDFDIFACSPDDLAAILYTSGTTGRPKGAMLTHGNLGSNASILVALWGFSADDVLLHALPIFHVHGLFVALHCAMMVGAQMLFHEAFEAKTVRRDLSRTTVLMGVPTFYTRLMALPDFGPGDCAAMRLFISGSAPMTAEVHAAFEQASGHKVLERYGMTETGMITSNPLVGERIAGTVGFALPGTEIRVADESGVPLPTGHTGIVEVKGPNVFPGYWQLPDKTAQEFRADGFFITGDMGVQDAEGRLTLVGRAKDLIISGGYNIYPTEIESVLDALPEVKESAVIGAPHADLGEGVVAVLVATSSPLTDKEILSALETELARFKLPRRLFWVDDLPRNAMGKVQKKSLRETYKSAYES